MDRPISILRASRSVRCEVLLAREGAWSYNKLDSLYYGYHDNNSACYSGHGDIKHMGDPDTGPSASNSFGYKMPRCGGRARGGTCVSESR